MSEQEKMTVAQLARYLPPEARFVARGAEPCYAWRAFSERPPRHNSLDWCPGESCKVWTLAVVPDLDKPWAESLTEIRPKERWRAEDGEPYWSVAGHGTIGTTKDTRMYLDDCRFECGNYWQTEVQAEAFGAAVEALAMKMHEEDDD